MSDPHLVMVLLINKSNSSFLLRSCCEISEKCKFHFWFFYLHLHIPFVYLTLYCIILHTFCNGTLLEQQCYCDRQCQGCITETYVTRTISWIQLESEPQCVWLISLVTVSVLTALISCSIEIKYAGHSIRQSLVYISLFRPLRWKEWASLVFMLCHNFDVSPYQPWHFRAHLGQISKYCYIMWRAA
jgi:hypothetical protein